MPGIPNGISGIRAGTPYNLLIDAGVVYQNIAESFLNAGGADAYADAIDASNTWNDPNGDSVAPTRFGATRGGVTINPGITERNVEVDSKRIPIKGFSRIDEIMPRLTMNLLELGDPNTVRRMLGGVSETSPTGWKRYVPRLVVADEDYLGNVAAFVSISGEVQPMAAVLPNAKVVERNELATQDKAEVAQAITFQGHALASDPFDVPLHWYVPDEYGS